MKNFLLVVATMLVATFVFTDAAVAGGGKSKVVVNNTNPNGGRAITVFVIEQSAAGAIATKGDLLRHEHKTVQAGRVETFTRSNGDYVIAAVDTAVFNSQPNSYIFNPTDFASLIRTIRGRDLAGNTFTSGGPPIYVPNLNGF